MIRVASLLLLLFALFPLFASPAPARADGCAFVLGFKTLHDLIPNVVGNCVEDEHFNPANGDSLQATITPTGAQGLLVWRKADNWTAFTDGFHTWINGPLGLQERLNTECFAWEKGCNNGSGLAASCQIKSMQPISHDDALRWLAQSASTSNRVGGITTHQDTSGVWQVYKVDPSSLSETCLSCQDVSGGPSATQNKRYAFWDPQHKWIIVDAEMLSHPAYPSDARLRNGALSNGLGENFYAMSPDGSTWYDLTNFQWGQVPPNGDRAVQGAFNPKFTHDGTRVVWATSVRSSQRGQPGHQLGAWELWMANYTYDANGVPSFQNMTNISPKDPAGSWYEPHDFSSDDRWLLLTSDMGNTGWQIGMDIFRIDISGINLATGQLNEVVQDLTNTPNQWDEHAYYSPDGQKIIWSSSSLNDSDPQVQNNTVHTDIMMMNADGSDKVQLTHFNTASGYPESTPGVRVLTNVPVWSKDGTQIYLQVGYAPLDQAPRSTWEPPVTGGKEYLLTFQGSCGG